MFQDLPASTPRASRMELAAHELVACGFTVVPMEPRGKIPLTRHGWKDGTRSHEQVTKFWRQHRTANVGIVTGSHVELFVLDIDGPQGEAALALLGVMPTTVQALTGKGRHLYFRTQPGMALRSLVGRLGPQIDTRGDGGMVVAPPSTHLSGRVYRWADGCSPDEAELAQLPQSIIEAMLATTAPRACERVRMYFPQSDSRQALDRRALEAFRAWFAKVDRCLGPGKRNATAWRIAVRALNAMPLAYVYETLENWNALNRPPLGARELQAVIQSAQQHAQRSRAS